jgi:glycosyltransferase involved in cell wall biosynthesis
MGLLSLLALRMKILQLFNRYLERGGEESSVERIFSALAQRHEVRQVSFASEDWIREPVHKRLLQPLKIFYNPSSVELLRNELKANRPDVALLHNIFPVGSLGIYQVLLDEGIPIIQYIHNFRPFSVNGYCWAKGRIIEAGLRQNFWPEIACGSWQRSRLKTACYGAVIWTGHKLGVWNAIEGWVAISEFMRDTFVSGGIDPAKIAVVRHSWELSQPAGTHTPGALPDGGSKNFLFLGRMTEEKGLRVLAEAWEKVEATRQDGRLVVAGDGPMADWFNSRALSLRRVDFVGYVDGERKRDLIRDCDAMIVPSVWWEPLGLVVYEAYDFSKPVLAAASGGLSEIVTPGLTGWSHVPGDAEMLAAHITEVLDNPTEARRRGLQGRMWLERETKVGSWMQALEQLMGKVTGI